MFSPIQSSPHPTGGGVYAAPAAASCPQLLVDTPPHTSSVVPVQTAVGSSRGGSGPCANDVQAFAPGTRLAPPWPPPHTSRCTPSHTATEPIRPRGSSGSFCQRSFAGSYAKTFREAVVT